jgi:hypothetical protein
VLVLVLDADLASCVFASGKFAVVCFSDIVVVTCAASRSVILVREAGITEARCALVFTWSVTSAAVLVAHDGVLFTWFIVVTSIDACWVAVSTFFGSAIKLISVIVIFASIG